MDKTKSISHDKLQYQCHTWLFNTHPELRQLSHANFNDIKVIEKIIGGLMKIKIPDRVRRIALSSLKSIGLVKGILDYNFYYSGVLHVFDFKVGNDRLSPEQKLTIERVEAQGGKGHEIRSLEEFQEIINGIIC